MHSRWYSVAVVLLWLTTMGWLVTQKVLPSLVVGEPPDYPTILTAQREYPPIGWKMYWCKGKPSGSALGKPIGWAFMSTANVANGLTELRSQVHVASLPVHEISDLVAAILRPMGIRDDELRMDVFSTLTFDPLRRLSQFESIIRFQPKVDAVKLRGRIEGPKLMLSIHCGGTPPQETELPAPRSAIVNDGLSPQGYLPGLRKGQKWTVETYNPVENFNPLPMASPGKILYASVDAGTGLDWNGGMVSTWLVVYRTEPGADPDDAKKECGKLWVRTTDGMVLKQQATVLDSTLTFVRTSNEEAEMLAKRAVDDR